jgi:hypothetical protein
MHSVSHYPPPVSCYLYDPEMLPGYVNIPLQLVLTVSDAVPRMPRAHWPDIVHSPASPNPETLV